MPNIDNVEKNLHLVHLEDAIINNGVEGARLAINHLRSIRNTLAGTAERSMNISTKFDGSPAIFAGIDPSDGKFFVAKKSIFNKNSKVYKTKSDIDADTSGDLNEKLKLALDEFPKLGIKGVIQGDFLYAKNDLKKITIDNESYITFHPNTIVYAVPEKSKLAKRILRSKLGVVWHTVYRGDSFETMSANFGEKIGSDHKKVSSIVSIDPSFDNNTVYNAEQVTKFLSNAGKTFQSLNSNALNGIGTNEKRRVQVNKFINTKIRNGERITNTNKFVDDLIVHLNEYFDSEISKKKSKRGIASAEQAKEEVMSYFKKSEKEDIEKMFVLYNYVIDAKTMLIENMNGANEIKTFLKTREGYVATGQEGFVAMDHFGKNAVKLVNRLEFSKANFNPEFEKGWKR